jgi:Periplasmic protein involved in polysaccharide export
MLKTTASSLTRIVFVTTVLLPWHATAQTTSTGSAAATQTVPATTATTASRTTKGTTGRWTDQDYRLGAGDKLRVEVYKQEQFSQSLQIRPDGKITLTLIGDVPAAGLTPLELRDKLTAALKEYINNPVVTVIVQDAIAAQITVIGDVRSQGPQVLNGSVTMLQALAKAGGPGEFADKKNIHILRTNGSRTETIPFNYKQALKGEIEPVYLQPGDTIVVP